MNRGNIPGFYYDEGKNKYFKIQANHVAPDNAKYAKSRIVQEQRIIKKRKLEKKAEEHRFAHTIKRPPVLRSSAVGGIGLLREQGIQEAKAFVDNAFVSQCLPEMTPVCQGPHRLKDAILLPDTKQILIAATHASMNAASLVASDWSWIDGSASTTLSLAGFNSAISTLSTALYQNDQRVVACASQYQNGNVYVGSTMGGNSVYITLGTKASNITASSFNKTTGSVVVLGTSNILVLDPLAQTTKLLKLDAEKDYSQAVDWLDANIVAYAQQNGLHRDGDSPMLMLWDSRTSNGTSARFQLGERVTGILRTENNAYGGNQLIISTNHHIQLFDTRMHGRKAVPTQLKAGVLEVHTPVFSFRHLHGGPRSRWCVGGIDSKLIAAADESEVVRVYSTRTGRYIGELPSIDRKTEPMGSSLTSLKWFDSVDGCKPAFTGIYGGERGTVCRWEWGGNDDQEVC